MSELSTMSKFRKFLNLGVMSTIVLGTGACGYIGINPSPGLKGSRFIPAECVPSEENSKFDIAIKIHESAKDKIKDVTSLCILTEVLAGMSGALGRNEITYISKSISREEFRKIISRDFYYSNDMADKKYDQITSLEDPLGGLHAKVYNGSSRSIIVVDSLTGTETEESPGSLEFAFLIANAGEIAHERPDNLVQVACGSGDVDDFPFAYTVALAARDRHFSVNRGVDELAGIHFDLLCDGSLIEIKIIPELYQRAYDFSLYTEGEKNRDLNGLTLFELVQKALGTFPTP